MLIFLLDQRRFAIDTASIEGVMVAENIFFLPHAEPPVRGIITHRTELVVVADIKGLFSKEESTSPPFTIIILSKDDRRFALSLGDVSPRFVDKKDCTFLPANEERDEYLSAKMRYRGVLFDVIEPEAVYKKILESFQ
ncbi:MAG TPA: chemotaxis protein CheW [Deltaproteobacteria bacterium]|nr:chemotaxis protein CheW [Deltaproteobacteria bacterium]